MIQVLIKALTALGMKLLATLATEKLLEWAFFKLADVLVKRTDTKHDDEFLEEVKKAYNAKV